VAVAKVANASVTHYSSLYLGLVNRFGSPGEWPYPLYVAGSTTRVYALFNSTILTYVSGIVELIATSSDDNGPGFYRRSDGVWSAVNNSRVTGDETSPARSTTTVRTQFPVGESSIGQQIVDNDDLITALPGTGGVRLEDIIPTGGVPGTPTKTLHPTPNTGDDLRRLYPCTIQFSTTGPPIERDIFGEVDGVFWLSAADVATPLTPEDFIVVGDVRYRVFKSGNRALDYTFMAIEEK
jgi:hypothetical protein